MNSDEAISRRLSYVLRHNPGSAGIALDAAGWVDIDALLAGLADIGFPLTEQRLRSVVASNDKSRFSIDGGRIRAAQGHSVAVDLGLAPRRPPALLLPRNGREVRRRNSAGWPARGRAASRSSVT